MGRKSLIQLILISLIFIFLIFFYYEFLKTKKNSQNIKSKNITQPQKTGSSINELQYFSKDINGNIYLLKAKSGSADANNSDLIYLESVNAKINFDKNNQIIVSSDKAVYNNNTYDTEFIGNVKIAYENHKINCENMSALISQNRAILSGNVNYLSTFTKMYADKIEYDLEKRTSKISMINQNEKVKITHKN